MRTEFIQLHPNDNILVALDDLKVGETLFHKTLKIEVKNFIPAGHKIAISNISTGTDLLKYGAPIGKAIRDILVGEWVHTHNMITKLEGLMKYQFSPSEKLNEQKGFSEKTFYGFLRRNGDVGIRNEVWIIAVTACINGVVKTLEKQASQLQGVRDTDGVFSFGHPYGCSQTGDDLDRTRTMLSALAKHPNAGAVLIVGLGCENITMESFKRSLGKYNPKRIEFLTVQDCSDEIEAGLTILQRLIRACKEDQRSEIPISKLRIGLKCGGSDGFSGITANPLVGMISDVFIEYEASSIMTEVPEMFGAEQILFNRCINESVFDKAVTMLNDEKAYLLSHGQSIYDNPSPGNIEGGITTLEEKSLGCILKGGNSSIVEILKIGELTAVPGLSLLEGPGNDPVSVSILTASHVHIILFTTGRGTPYGGPVPTLKISTNNLLAEKKPGWIDYNAGKILTGINPEICTSELFELILKIASGEKITANEKNNYREFNILKTGVTL